MRRILLADDERHAIRIIKLALERESYQVDFCLDGEQALAQLRAYSPDVLITDIQMPRMDGEELCRHIQQELPDREFLIIVLTSKTETELRGMSHELSNIMFLEKPVSIRKLISILNGYFEKQGIN